MNKYQMKNKYIIVHCTIQKKKRLTLIIHLRVRRPCLVRLWGLKEKKEKKHEQKKKEIFWRAFSALYSSTAISSTTV